MATETIATLQPWDVFTTDYAYTRFTFGTDQAYHLSYNEPSEAIGTPWANPIASVLSDTPQEKPTVVAHLPFGSLVTTPGYGTYRLERDHNRNVKFVAVHQNT